MSIASQTRIEKSRMTMGLVLCAVVLTVVGIALRLAHNGAAARALVEQQRSNEIAAESRAVCEKWGMPVGTPAHVQCVDDLHGVRERQTRRIADDIEIP
jgi:cell division protein FtsN